MAGGRGTRFWPLSRTNRPKQLLPLASDVSLLRETVDRVLPLVGPDRILVITSGDLADPIAAQLPELDPRQIVAEPVGRNTAPCAVLGVGLATAMAGEGPVALLPADHAIPDDDTFRDQLATAFARTDEGAEVVTFGIPPTRPETGYGYLETDPSTAGMAQRPGICFVEKPDRVRAQEYLESGRHFWNSGIFVWNSAAFTRHAKALAPAIVSCLEPAIVAYGTEGFAAALDTAYQQCPAESIDYAVMEKLPGFEVLVARFHWSDLGSWSAWGDLAPELGEGNRGTAELIDLDSRDNVIHAPGKQVSLVGVEGLVVVDTGDALLICRREDDQRVKDIIARLEDSGRRDLL